MLRAREGETRGESSQCTLANAGFAKTLRPSARCVQDMSDSIPTPSPAYTVDVLGSLCDVNTTPGLASPQRPLVAPIVPAIDKSPAAPPVGPTERIMVMLTAIFLISLNVSCRPPQTCARTQPVPASSIRPVSAPTPPPVSTPQGI